MTSLSHIVRTNPACDSASLPPALQLHCRMYHDDVITGSLCAPLCDEGQLCDVTSFLGSGHKEVMVTQCPTFCSEGQNVKAILKHDEFSASPEGYDTEYSRMNNTHSRGNASFQREKLRALLSLHLPSKDVAEFLESSLQAIDPQYNLSANETLPVSVYNSLVLLFRQKEYVLLEAYRHKGVFPTLYGTCGPLYLVEYCHPLLAAVTSPRQHENTLSWIPDSVHRGDTSTMSKLHREHTFVSSHAPPTNDATHGDAKKGSESHVDTRFNNAVTEDDISDSKETSPSASFISVVFSRLSSHYNTVITISGIRNAISVGSELLYKKYVSRRDILNKMRTPDTENSKRIVVNPATYSKKESTGLSSWKQRASTALAILRFLQHVEHLHTLPTHPLLCDPKLEHFAVSARDTRLRLIDADLILFEAERDFRDVDTGACAEHRDCSDVMCRGWCNTTTGRCERLLTNNNLQGICENVFLRPSPEFGPLFVDIPSTVYHDVTRVLCHCATDVTLVGDIPMQKPSAAVRDKLMEVLERSLLSDEQEQFTQNIDSRRDAFLFQSC
ncbi:uncharacterized protein [Littorina saxatilis]|uniref:uncharacterized protein n=1 Tax=Littorina saxatilis TaxID=31220 RepID=UPI0038B607D4